MRFATSCAAVLLALAIIMFGGGLIVAPDALDALFAGVAEEQDGAAAADGARTPDDYAAELKSLIEKQLSRKPTSSVVWLWLAQSSPEGADEQLNEAIQMSLLTGRNEYEVVLERVVLGLHFWDRLNDDLRQSTVMQLAAIMPMANRLPFARMKAALDRLGEDDRAEIRAALAMRVDNQSLIRLLGL